MSAVLRWLSHGAVVRGAQLVVGLLLSWAALAKLGEIPALARDIHHYQLLPAAAENLLAIVLPWIELTAGLALLLGVRARAGAIVAAALLAIVTAAVALAVARGLNLECGCFGSAVAGRVGAAKLVQNVCLLALAVIGALPPRPAAASRPAPAPAG